ncbi:MAG: type II toxin-antitoxin system VapC family toxin [Methanobacteriota archaeon]
MLIDSFAWIEYFMGTNKGIEVKKIVDDTTIAYTSPIITAEIYSKSIRADGIEKAEERKDFILHRCVFVPADEEIALEAGKIHAQMKIGLADAFILATASKKNTRILTGDPHFKGLENVEFLGG